MNISRIQKMVLEGDLSVKALCYLLQSHGECEHLDFKEKISLQSDHECISLVKDIIGMKNIGGGYLIFGVKDKTWEPLGLEKMPLIDSKMIKEKIVKYAGLDIAVDYVSHKIFIGESKKIFSILLTRSSSKRKKLKSPSICKKSFLEKEKWGIRTGDIYIRDGDQTKRLDNLDKLSEKLEELEYIYQDSEFEERNKLPSPFEIENGLYRLLPKEYGHFIGRKKILEKINYALEKDPRIWIINIYGPGGVGKSALATRIAYDCYHQKKYEAIIHLSAKDLELSNEGGIKFLTPSLISLEDFLDKILILFSHSEFDKEPLSKKKEIVNQLLSAWSTLIILDNMETVRDNRIMDFVRGFPQTTRSKVLLTSRIRSSSWELPIQVPELSQEETQDFLFHKSQEMNIDFPLGTKSLVRKISEISGGLPLAIQWILGEYAKLKSIKSIMKRVISPDSPLLEFSFRHSWGVLGPDAKNALAVLSIFANPPTLHEWRTILNWSKEKVESAIYQLIESTFITERTDINSGNKIYSSLPITLSFARNELLKDELLSKVSHERYQEYTKRIELSEKYVEQNKDLFKKFDAKTDIQKRAITLARMAEGQFTSFGIEEAESYYKQAIDTDPHNIFVLVSYGRFKSELMEYDESLSLLERALDRKTKKTAFFILYNIAEVYGKMKDYSRKIATLKEAIKNKDSEGYLYLMAKHSLGVALGKRKRHSEAITLFKEIIEDELSEPKFLSNSVVVAARTLKISMKRIYRLKDCNDYIESIIRRIQNNQSNEKILTELKHIRYKE